METRLRNTLARGYERGAGKPRPDTPMKIVVKTGVKASLLPVACPSCRKAWHELLSKPHAVAMLPNHAPDIEGLRGCFDLASLAVAVKPKL
jgi:hypothetical protein